MCLHAWRPIGAHDSVGRRQASRSVGFGRDVPPGVIKRHSDDVTFADSHGEGREGRNLRTLRNKRHPAHALRGLQIGTVRIWHHRGPPPSTDHRTSSDQPASNTVQRAPNAVCSSLTPHPFTRRYCSKACQVSQVSCAQHPTTTTTQHALRVARPPPCLHSGRRTPATRSTVRGMVPPAHVKG